MIGDGKVTVKVNVNAACYLCYLALPSAKDHNVKLLHECRESSFEMSCAFLSAVCLQQVSRLFGQIWRETRPPFGTTIWFHVDVF